MVGVVGSHHGGQANRGTTSIAKRLERLVARWRELAEVGYPRDRTNRYGWAEHLRRLAESEGRDSESGNDPALAEQPPKYQDREPQVTQGGPDAEGLQFYLALLSRRR